MLVVFAVLLSALAAGCGGGGDNESESTTTAAKAAPHQRFTEAEWKQYQADVTAFQTLNDATLVKVTACTKPINPPPGAMSKCVGESLTNLGAATEKVGQTLEGLTSSVGGACLTALNGLLNYIRPYQASINSLQNTIDADNYAAAYSSSSSLKTARADGRAANTEVMAACAPA
jgi:hypothetical protein